MKIISNSLRFVGLNFPVSAHGNTPESSIKPSTKLNDRQEQVTCLSDRNVRPHPLGIGDEYNDDTGESDDGDAHTTATGFRYPSETAGIERRAEEGAARADGGTGDRRWHDMYR